MTLLIGKNGKIPPESFHFRRGVERPRAEGLELALCDFTDLIPVRAYPGRMNDARDGDHESGPGPPGATQPAIRSHWARDRALSTSRSVRARVPAERPIRLPWSPRSRKTEGFLSSATTAGVGRIQESRHGCLRAVRNGRGRAASTRRRRAPGPHPRTSTCRSRAPGSTSSRPALIASQARLEDIIGSRFWRFTAPRPDDDEESPAPPPTAEAGGTGGRGARFAALWETRRHPPALPVTRPVLVSIVISTRNDCLATLACLKSIQEQTRGLAYEVILVDDASSDLTPLIFGGIEGLVYVRNWRRRGLSGSYTRGASRAGEVPRVPEA